MLKFCAYLAGIFFVGTNVQAVDFVNAGKPNNQTTQGYLLQPEDTVSGYPIFQADRGWQLATVKILATSGGTRSLGLPQVILNRYEAGKWAMTQVVLVTAESDMSEGWTGDPCAGDKIVKINVVRGRLDRCATAEVVPFRVDDKQTEVLKISFTETNAGGRYYASTFFVNLERLNLSYGTVTSKNNEFNKQLKTWMEQMQGAVVKAAGYDKPADAYSGIPSLAAALSSFALVAPSNSAAVATSRPIETTSSTAKTDTRPIAVRWDGYSGLISGVVILQERGSKGSIKGSLPRGDGECSGNYQLTSVNKGVWAISCTNGMASTGTFEAFGENKGAAGSGVDAKGNRVEYTIGAGG